MMVDEPQDVLVITAKAYLSQTIILTNQTVCLHTNIINKAPVAPLTNMD